jgi:type I restriction enzyme M protein
MTATTEQIKGHNYLLTPGRYVGTADEEQDSTSFSEYFMPLRGKLLAELDEADRLSVVIREQLRRIDLE